MIEIKRPVNRINALFEAWLIELPQTVTEHLREHLLYTLIAESKNLRCPYCDRIDPTIQVRTLNTEYANESLNFMFSCSRCYVETYSYYNDLWTEYYNAIGAP